MLISSPAVEKEWGWGNGLSNPWQMRGFHSKEWPWEFSFGQTRLRSKAGILFSVGSGRRFASSRSQPGLHGLPPTAPAPASPKQDREGEGRARANAGGGALKKPLSKEGRESVQNSKARPSDSRRHSERILLGHLFRSPPPQFTLQLDAPAIAVIYAFCDLSELPLWASVFPTVCDLTEGCVPNTVSRKAPPSTLNTGSSAP